MLTRKIEINYRESTDRFEKCRYCAEKEWTPIKSCAFGPEEILRYDWRCKVIGLESSRRYGVQQNYVCDHFHKE
jgi:hypothetical protein